MQIRYPRTKEDLRSVIVEIMAVMEEHGGAVIKFDKKPRSIPQNDTFHMWCAEFASEQTKKGRPLDPETAKLWFKHRFLGYEDVQMGTRTIPEQLKSTKGLSMGEYYWFMERVWEYAASEFQIFLTIPADSQFKKLQDKQSA